MHALLRHLSIRQKLTLLMTLVSCIALLLAGVAFGGYDLLVFYRSNKGDLVSLARIIGANSVGPLTFDDPKAAAETLAALSVKPHIVSAGLFDKRSRGFAVYRRVDAKVDPIPSQPDADGVRLVAWRMVLFHTVLMEGERIGTVYIKADLGEIFGRFSGYLATALFVVLLCGGAAFVVSSGLQQVISRPILQVADAAWSVAMSKDYSLRVPQTSTDEIGLLTMTFNEMLVQIQRRDAELKAFHKERDEARLQDLAREKLGREEAQRALLQSEEELRQAQKMEAVGRLAGGVAHDFNNLLNVIIGYGDLVLRRLPPKDSLRGKVEQILKASDRAAALTKQLVAFSRKQVLAPRVLDLNAVVAGMEPMLKRVIGEDVLLVSAPGCGLASVKADQGQIEQVLMNLAVNARDAMPEGGTLTIGTQNFDANAKFVEGHPEFSPGAYVLITVSDTGCGMDVATLARIFEPFFTTKPVGKGTGLGLSTVYGIVKQSGGHVAAESEPGMGAIFRVYLPAVVGTAVEQTEATVPVAALPAGSETILLVEDEEMLRNLTSDLLQQSGFRVLAAADGHEALEMVERDDRAIDLLLTDVMMPRLNGPELFKKLTAKRRGLKVVFVSGYTFDALGTQNDLGSDVCFLQKPVTPGALVQKIRETLDKR